MSARACKAQPGTRARTVSEPWVRLIRTCYCCLGWDFMREEVVYTTELNPEGAEELLNPRADIYLPCLQPILASKQLPVVIYCAILAYDDTLLLIEHGHSHGHGNSHGDKPCHGHGHESLAPTSIHRLAVPVCLSTSSSPQVNRRHLAFSPFNAGHKQLHNVEAPTEHDQTSATDLAGHLVGSQG